MRVLVPETRKPPPPRVPPKPGGGAHDVGASATCRPAPGGPPRHAAARVTASPRFDRPQFLADVNRIAEKDRIDLLLPAFEEVFYLAWHADELAPRMELFFPRFETLRRLHDKSALVELAESLGIPTPRTLVVESQDDLRAAVADLDRYFARACFSRGGVSLLTNVGPLASQLAIEDCHPTPENPWLVQEFVDGEDLCTFSVVHHGKISAHSAYVHPRELEHAGGIVFESVVDPASLGMIRAMVDAVGYHGQISFDFRVGPKGPVLIECNPRPTAGVFVMTPEMLDEAIFAPGPSTRVAPAGVRHKYSMALVRDMLLHWSEAREDLMHLFSAAKDVYAERGDFLPAIYQILSYSHVAAFKWQKRRGERRPNDLAAGYFHDVLYDGEALGERKGDTLEARAS